MKKFKEPKYADRYEAFYPADVIEKALPDVLRCFHCGVWFTRKEKCQNCGSYICPFCHGCLCQNPLPRNVFLAVQDTWIRATVESKEEKKRLEEVLKREEDN